MFYITNIMDQVGLTGNLRTGRHKQSSWHLVGVALMRQNGAFTNPEQTRSLCV